MNPFHELDDCYPRTTETPLRDKLIVLMGSDRLDFKRYTP